MEKRFFRKGNEQRRRRGEHKRTLGKKTIMGGRVIRGGQGGEEMKPTFEKKPD